MNRVETIGMPDWVWGRLASIAAVKGLTVQDVIADSIMQTIGRTEPDHLAELAAELYASRTSKRESRLRQLHSRGLSEAEIASEMGIKVQTAHRELVRLRLSNRRSHITPKENAA